MITCTFAGHKTLLVSALNQIVDALESIIATENYICCYVEGMGEFDSQAASAVRILKNKYPKKVISLTLVLPYMQQKINKYKYYYDSLYDDIIIPQDLIGIHYKRSITIRNRWMVDHSDYIIAMVWRNYGGAYNTLSYAIKQKKQIIFLKN